MRGCPFPYLRPRAKIHRALLLPALALAAVPGPLNCSVTTIVGTGAAGDNGDGGPAVAAGLNYALGTLTDPSNNLYVASEVGNKVRFVNMTSTIISTVVGTGTMGCTTAPGAALAANIKYPFSLGFQPGLLIVVDQGCNCVRAVNVSGYMTTFAGTCGSIGTSTGDGTPAANATLNVPTRLRVSASNDVCVRVAWAGVWRGALPAAVF